MAIYAAANWFGEKPFLVPAVVGICGGELTIGNGVAATCVCLDDTHFVEWPVISFAGPLSRRTVRHITVLSSWGNHVFTVSAPRATNKFFFCGRLYTVASRALNGRDGPRR
jgi:hypothetical protein